MELSVGQTFEDYEILGILGTGGMGKVYRVRNKISDRVEAMKILLSELNVQPELVERFTREIRIFGSLHHPNITELRTALHVNQQLVMIMELIEGSSLDALMKLGRIPMPTYVDYMCQALSALSYAHAKGVVHRDIKPGNMMVTPAGLLKLMDFGIAKTVTDPQLTKTGLLVGSVYYISPEQIEGKDPDGRSDLYSLGVTLYQLATGKRPFEGASDYQIITAHMQQNPQPPRELDPSLPAALNDIIMLALERDPARRFQTADAFKNALASLIAPPAITPSPAVSARRNNRLMYMLAGAAATIAVIVAGIIEIPKIRHTSAAGAQDSAQTAPAQKESTKEAPAKEAPVQKAEPETPPAAEAAVAAPAVSTPPATASAAAPVKPVAAMRKDVQVAAQRPSAQVPPTAPAQVAQQAPAQPAPPAPVQQPPQTASPANTAAVAQLRERSGLMSVRVATVRTSFQNLQRQQAASGLSPRSDMVAADQRLGYQLEQAEASLQQGDVDGAKKRLDAAERDLEKLESFLGK